MQKVIDITCMLRDKLSIKEKILLVTNVGGYTNNAHVESNYINKMRENLTTSFSLLDTRNYIEIIPQTMPPFPWHFGGQRFHNIFVDHLFIKSFCEEHSMRICLDVSHSKLACNYLSTSFHDFLEAVLPFTAHLHLADAQGLDGEGLQINDGEIDWTELFSMINRLSPKASFIPEIWQGHKNFGEGAWIALDKLEKASNLSYIRTQ